MKYIKALLFAFAILIFTASFSRAGEIHLEWDPHPESTVANPIRFRVEAANIPTPNTWVSFDAGTETNKVLTGLTPGKYLFRAFAILGAEESLPSEMIQESIKPLPPGNLRKKVALQTSTDLNHWNDLYVYTDESDAKRFYRIGVSVN